MKNTNRKNVSPEKCNEYSKILSEMINCKTVFSENGENNIEFEKFYSVIDKNFPNLREKAKKLTFGSGCFFYFIEGKNPEKNILLMSHHDVVDSGEGWETEPFSATETIMDIFTFDSQNYTLSATRYGSGKDRTFSLKKRS